jgi:hypothetical protein
MPTKLLVVCTLSRQAQDFFTSPKRATRLSEQADEPIVIAGALQQYW